MTRGKFSLNIHALPLFITREVLSSTKLRVTSDEHSVTATKDTSEGTTTTQPHQEVPESNLRQQSHGSLAFKKTGDLASFIVSCPFSLKETKEI